MSKLDMLYGQLHPKIKEQDRRAAFCVQAMADHAAELPGHYGFADAHQLARAVEDGCKYHDIGYAVRQDIFMFLQDGAYELIDTIDHLHPINSGYLVACLGDEVFPARNHKKMVTDICLYHHERYDGSGFPYGHAGKNLPLAAELCGIACDIDRRVFGRGGETENRFRFVAEFLQSQRGGRYSGAAVDCFAQAERRILDFYIRSAVIACPVL